jgi:hypothetical protein
MGCRRRNGLLLARLFRGNGVSMQWISLAQAIAGLLATFAGAINLVTAILNCRTCDKRGSADAHEADKVEPPQPA